MRRLSLDVLVATYRRAPLLERTLRSLIDAPVPDGLTARVMVAQNDNERDTAATIARWIDRHPDRVRTIRVAASGKSNAINAAVAATCGDLVGIVDDDEVVEWSWYSAVAEAFDDPAVDFIGGPCLPAWEAAPPGWLPRKWQGVIGFVDNGANRMPFRAEGAILIGGNAVIRREVLQRVGLFSTDLGPTAERRMFSCEDEDLHARLIAAGARGHYVPALRVRHRVPPHRMTKRYYRRWSFWNGVSKSVLDAQRPLPGHRIGQIPRHLVGAAAWGVLHSLGARRDPAAAFDGQLRVVHLAGFIYGAYWYRNAER